MHDWGKCLAPDTKPQYSSLKCLQIHLEHPVVIAMANQEKEQSCSINTEGGKSEKTFWYFDLIEAKSEQLKPMLNSVLNPELKDRLLLDQLDKEDVLVMGLFILK